MTCYKKRKKVVAKLSDDAAVVLQWFPLLFHISNNITRCICLFNMNSQLRMHSIFSDSVSKTIKCKSVQSPVRFLRALAISPPANAEASPAVFRVPAAPGSRRSANARRDPRCARSGTALPPFRRGAAQPPRSPARPAAAAPAALLAGRDTATSRLLGAGATPGKAAPHSPVPEQCPPPPSAPVTPARLLLTPRRGGAAGRFLPATAAPQRAARHLPAGGRPSPHGEPRGRTAPHRTALAARCRPPHRRACGLEARGRAPPLRPEGGRGAEPPVPAGMERPRVGKAPRKKRRASPLPGAAGSRAAVSQPCRRRLFGSAAPPGGSEAGGERRGRGEGGRGQRALRRVFGGCGTHSRLNGGLSRGAGGGAGRAR